MCVCDIVYFRLCIFFSSEDLNTVDILISCCGNVFHGFILPLSCIKNKQTKQKQAHIGKERNLKVSMSVFQKNYTQNEGQQNKIGLFK